MNLFLLLIKHIILDRNTRIYVTINYMQISYELKKKMNFLLEKKCYEIFLTVLS